MNEDRTAPVGEALGGDQWRAELARRFHGLTASARDPGPGQGAAGLVHSVGLDDIGVHRIRGNPQVLTRSATAVRRQHSDLLKVCLMVQGHATIEQSNVAIDIGPGEFAVYDTDRPYRLTNHDSWQVSVMTVAREDLSVSPMRLAGLMQRPIDAAIGPGQVYASYLDSIVSLSDGPSGLATAHVRTAGIALLNAALTQRIDDAVEIGPDVVAEQLVGYVEAHLDDPQLGVERIAAIHHMSVRSLQRLLASQGLTFSSLVRDRRLAAIRRDLGDRALAHRSISAVGARWGVVDQPWLSRTFRAAFGISPSEFRRHALSAASAESP